MSVRILIADPAVPPSGEATHDVADVVVVDLDGADDPARTLRSLRRLHGVAIVAIGTSEDPRVVDQALAAGATSYVVKGDGHAELLAAARHTANGECYLNPLLRSRVDALRGDGVDLGQRERTILQLVARGHTNREIAAALSLSLRTIELQRARLREKLGLTSRAEMIRYALELGLADPAGPA